MPDNIKILLTTSKNKEGINIDNEKYTWIMYAESHWNDELMQMYGRIRSGLSRLYVVHDAKQHITSNPKYELDYYMSKESVVAFNKAFDDWCEAKGYFLYGRYKVDDIRKEIKKALKFIHT